MRILAVFLAGLIVFFLIGHLISLLTNKFPQLSKLFPIPHSLVGFILFLAGMGLIFIVGGNPQIFLGSLFISGAGIGLILHHALFRSYLISEEFETRLIRTHSNKVDRFLEMLPGLLTWIALTSPVWLSFTLPFALAYLIILADIYWLISALKIAASIILGYKKMEAAKKVDWLSRLETDFPSEWEKYYHLVVIPTYKEPLEVLTPAFDAVKNSNYPPKKIFMVVGFEAREYNLDKVKIDTTIEYLNKLGSEIGGVFTTIHPAGLPGEIPGPGTNRNWMIRNAVKKLRGLKIKPDEIFVTTLDADFVIHQQFLAGALHKYLSTPTNRRDRSSYTGVFLYYNNYWQAPTPMRLISAGTAFWQLAEMVGSDKYMNFSSLSINLKSLLSIGLWIPDKVNDDSGFYWKAYYHFKGEYKVIPHFLPISADTVLDVNLLKTFQNQYLQQKRWAYGVEHIPFIVRQYFKNRDMSFWDKTDKLIFVFWGYLKWSILALFVTFAGLVIPIINPGYGASVVSVNLPVISSWVLTLAFLGIFATIFVHEKTVPPRPANWSPLKKLWSYIQWVLIPLVIVTISTVPAIDAQTSLMLGRYLEFRVTNKARSKST